jgi:hypothetical protein
VLTGAVVATLLEPPPPQPEVIAASDSRPTAREMGCRFIIFNSIFLVAEVVWRSRAKGIPGALPHSFCWHLPIDFNYETHQRDK